MTQPVGRMLALVVAVLPGIPPVQRWYLLAWALLLLGLVDLIAALLWITPGVRNYRQQVWAKAGSGILLLALLLILGFRIVPPSSEYAIGIAVSLVVDWIVWGMERSNRIPRGSQGESNA